MSKTPKTSNKRATKQPAEPKEKEILLSLRQIAVLTGHDRGFIARRISDADVRPSAERRSHLVYSASEIFRAFAATEPTAADIELMSPLDRLNWHRGTRVRNDLASRCLQLIPREEAEAEMSRVMKIISQALSLVPGLVASVEGTTPAMVERMQTHVQKIADQVSEITT